MKRILLLSLLIFFLYLFIVPTGAYAGHDACQNLPHVSLFVNPQEGDGETRFEFTIRMDQETYEAYDKALISELPLYFRNIESGREDEGLIPYSISDSDPPLIDPGVDEFPYEISQTRQMSRADEVSGVSSEYEIYVGFETKAEAVCSNIVDVFYEKEEGVPEVQIGDICNIQEINGGQQRCVEGSTCEEVLVEGGSKHICVESPPESSTELPPTVAPPPPRCENNTCDTALGPIDVSSYSSIVSTLFKYILFLAGAVMLFQFTYAGYTIMTSRGDPEKVSEARERIVAAIMGLLFIVFSVIILEIIGVDILRIPGFGK